MFSEGSHANGVIASYNHSHIILLNKRERQTAASLHAPWMLAKKKSPFTAVAFQNSKSECQFAICGVETKIYAASQILWCHDYPLRTALLNSVLRFCGKQHIITSLVY